VYVALLAIVALGVSNFDRPGSVWPSLVALLAIITGCGPIGPELSSGTLQLILVKPVKRWVYLVSRVTGVVLAVWIAAIVAAVCELVGRAMWSDALALPTIGIALGNALADAIFTVSLLTLLGSLTRAYFNVAIYLAVQFAFAAANGFFGFMRNSGTAIGRFLNEHIAIERAFLFVDRNLFPEFPPGFNRDWLLMVLSNAAIALVLACLAFRRREVPYGAE
jgi:ABC-type transport system involved in multi-copper enzyme maturation permease subunit